MFYAARIWESVVISLLLILFILSAYLQAGDHEFITFDDNVYVYENENVTKGLNYPTVKWAFKATEFSNWHPLTWLSHMLDVELFGLDPGFHHLTNIFLHVINTLLLFHLLKEITKNQWTSAAVALLFAIHPLHVESVAWVAERKDVLSTALLFLTLYSYYVYTKLPSLKRYSISLWLFALGLMAKPMLVSTPFLILLFDFWPVQRKASLKRLLLEKIPFLILAMISSAITLIVQKEGGAVASMEILPLEIRIANSLSSYFMYAYKTIVPYPLGIFYPHPRKILWHSSIFGAAFLLFFGYFALINRRNKPWLMTGFLWYVITLVPVIGIVQVGRQSMADRYTYVPLVGLFIAYVWELLYLFKEKIRTLSREKRIKFKIRISIMTFIGIMLMMMVTWKQVSLWQNGIMLYGHTIRITKDNDTMHSNLGKTYLDRKDSDPESAVFHLSKALKIEEKANRWILLGVAYFQLSQLDNAIQSYHKAIHMDPDSPAAYVNMGNALAAKGMLKEAEHYYSKAIDIDPGEKNAYNGIGLIHLRMGNIEAAIEPFLSVKKISGDGKNLDRAIYFKDKIDRAIKKVEDDLILNPEGPEFEKRLKRLEESKRELEEAVDFLRNALRPQKGYDERDFNISNYENVKRLVEKYEPLHDLYGKIVGEFPNTPAYLSTLDEIRQLQEKLKASQ